MILTLTPPCPYSVPPALSPAPRKLTRQCAANTLYREANHETAGVAAHHQNSERYGGEPRNSVAVHYQNAEKYGDEPQNTVAVCYQNAEKYGDETRNTVAVHYKNAKIYGDEP